MARTSWAQIGVVIMVLMLNAADCAAQSGGDPPIIVVAVVEPHTPKPGSDEIGYSVSLTGSKLSTVTSILDGLRQTRGKHLAILVHEAVPIGTVPIVVSMASKAGFLDYELLIFDGKRRGMTAVPGFKWVEFSTDPEVVRGLLR